MNTRFFLIAAAALTLAACDNNDPEVQNDPNEIRLYSEFASPAVTGTTRAPQGSSDNLQNQQFVDGTAISVQVTDNATSGAITYGLALYTANGSGQLTKSEGGPQYFPASGSNIDIYAYHPAGAGGELGAFAVQTDQSSTANYIASDLMWASLTNVSRTADACTLPFSHKLSRVNVHLVKGTGVEDSEINAATITLKDVIYKGTFTASTGTFTAAAADNAENKSDITIATNAGSTTTHSAVIVPQTVAGKTFAVTIGSTVKEYTIGSGITYAEGMQYTYTFTVNKTGLTVTSTITDWGDPDGWDDPGNPTSGDPEAGTILQF